MVTFMPQYKCRIRVGQWLSNRFDYYIHVTLLIVFCRAYSYWYQTNQWCLYICGRWNEHFGLHRIFRYDLPWIQWKLHSHNWRHDSRVVLPEPQCSAYLCLWSCGQLHHNPSIRCIYIGTRAVQLVFGIYRRRFEPHCQQGVFLVRAVGKPSELLSWGRITTVQNGGPNQRIKVKITLRLLVIQLERWYRPACSAPC